MLGALTAKAPDNIPARSEKQEHRSNMAVGLGFMAIPTDTKKMGTGSKEEKGKGEREWEEKRK